MTEIPSTPADGSTLVLVVPTFADTLTPKLTETASAIDLSCYFTGSGWKPSLAEQVIQDERLCSVKVYEQPGRSTDSLEVEYIDNTNTSYEEDFNKAKDTLVPKAPMMILIRTGKPYEEPLAVGDSVKIYPIKPGQYNELPPEANSVLKVGQKLFVTGSVSRVKMVA